MAKNANNKVSIWQSLHNAWKVQDIRKKLIYTFFMLILFRLVGVIPAPGVDYVRVKSAMSGSNLPLLDLVNMMTGSNFSNMTIMAMGITPYINSSIIMQLLTIAIPALERLSKSGPDGQKKIASITRYVPVVLAVIQAIGLVYTSLTPWLTLLAVLLFALVMTVVVTFVDMGVRRIQVQYAKRVTGRKMYGGQSSILPLKVCSVGVMPLIFAYSFMAFPSTLIQLFGGSESGLGLWWSRYMNYYSPLYMIVTALLIIAFTYFYTSISFQPDEMAKNIQQQGGVIPHVRPGKPTADFLARTNNRLTLFAALFLAVLATLPNLFTVGLQTSVPFAASSLLIAVSVVLETKRQLDDLLVSRNYDTLT